MLTRTQLILMTAMSTLGGSFAGFLAVGIAMGDITLALINLGVIVALFAIAFVLGGNKKTAETDCLHNYMFFPVDCELDSNTHGRRSSDIHVGGEINPEFKN